MVLGGLFLKKILQISVCERRICSAHGSGFNSAKDFLEICARARGFSHLEGQRVPAGRHNGLPALPTDFSLQSLPSKFHFNAFTAGFVTGPPQGIFRKDSRILSIFFSGLFLAAAL